MNIQTNCYLPYMNGINYGVDQEIFIENLNRCHVAVKFGSALNTLMHERGAGIAVSIIKEIMLKWMMAKFIYLFICLLQEYSNATLYIV